MRSAMTLLLEAFQELARHLAKERHAIDRRRLVRRRAKRDVELAALRRERAPTSSPTSSSRRSSVTIRGKLAGVKRQQCTST